jgi:hypothetical protein
LNDERVDLPQACEDRRGRVRPLANTASDAHEARVRSTIRGPRPVLDGRREDHDRELETVRLGQRSHGAAG